MSSASFHVTQVVQSNRASGDALSAGTVAGRAAPDTRWEVRLSCTPRGRLVAPGGPVLRALPPHLPRPPFEARVSGFKVEQRHLVVGERSFHFVSYEGRPANLRRGEPAEGPMWCLMSEGRRRPVMPHTPGLSADELDRQLLAWLHAEL